jgi:hypothetical protein
MAVMVVSANRMVVGANPTEETTTTEEETTTKSGVNTGSSDTNGNSPYYIDSSVTQGRDSDILMTNLSVPDGVYGGTLDVFFTVSTNYDFTAVSIDTSASDFPFVKNENAYKILVPAEWTDQPMNCSFTLDVKTNVKTGYYPLTFCVEYIKHGHHMYVNKTVDVYIEGEPETTEEETTTEKETETLPESVPRVIVTGYQTDIEKVYAGDEFELTLSVKNTSSETPVSNLKISLTAAANEFLPSSGSSTLFIDSIPAGATKTININMKAQASLEQKPYVLSVDMEYESDKHKAYTAKESISIPVFLETKLKVTSVEIMPDSVEVYGQANVMFNINNTGKSAISNVQVSVDSENVEAEDSFIGNIAAGATAYADFMVTGVSPTMDDGAVRVIISYEDSAGIAGTYETTINLYVYEPISMDVDEPFDVMPEPEEPQQDISRYIWIGIGVAAVILVIIIIVIKKRKRKKEEEELEDEIS